ncbi:MAG: hypothetical protein GOVbin4318_42 [Prokaryotic dsDNA virus sp.]|nr:MAG: hypothetical protein GOVbin4318_42 [Prokaryotic dsDNA virus sp.]|tara:strand:+ start:37167 stop:37487 length:321 start_codon:yes stop_codon:yes gene_type:complete
MSLLSLQKITLLSAQSATGAGSSFSVERSKGWTFTIASSSVTTGGTVDVEAYIGGSWRAIHSQAVTADGNVTVRDDHGHYEKIRGNVSARTDGTYSVFATGTTASL